MPLAGLLSRAAAVAANGNDDGSQSHWVVYCLEPAADAVVLMEMAPGAQLLKEPFLDRGVRQLAGARAAVVSTTTLEEWVENGGNGVNPLANGLGWVWNTGRCVVCLGVLVCCVGCVGGGVENWGPSEAMPTRQRTHNRCGSTLLHRVLLAAGVCSLSEPYWLEQLARARSQGALDDAGGWSAGVDGGWVGVGVGGQSRLFVVLIESGHLHTLLATHRDPPPPPPVPPD